MPAQVRCPNPACSKSLLLRDGTAGGRVRCPACGQAFLATAAGGDTARPPSPADAPPAGAGAAAMPPIGRFQVRGRLGAGAFGTVYRAYDPTLDREVALKVPNSGVLADANKVERFLREAKAAANLRHPHIVPVHDAGRDGDRYYIASEFIVGRPLSAAIGERGVDFRLAARLVRELAEALAYAHSEGVVHRDVKPDNVMLDAQDRVHLMDFGLAARRADEARLTNDGTVMGTPAYMAPEQAAGKAVGKAAEAGLAADQYSAGVVLYELLTGRVPFEGPQPSVVIHNVLHTDPDRPGAHRPDVPRDLETICLKAMAKRPDQRYPGCQALADDLRRWLDGEPIAARRLGPGERLARWAKKHKVVAGSLAAVAAALLIGMAASGYFAVRARSAAAEADRQAREAGQARLEAETNERAADEERRNAVASATAATEAKARADDEARKARESLREKEEALKRVVQAQQLAKKEQEAARTAGETAKQATVAKVKAEQKNEAYSLGRPQLYAHLQRQIESRRKEGVVEALAGVPDDKRGWEWHFLSNYLHRPTAVKLITAPGPRKSLCSLQPGGRTLATIDANSAILSVHDILTEKTRTFPLAKLAVPDNGAKISILSGYSVSKIINIYTFNSNLTIIDCICAPIGLPPSSTTYVRALIKCDARSRPVLSFLLSPDNMKAVLFRKEKDSNQQGLLSWSSDDGQIHFSPDGQRIAYSYRSNGISNAILFDASSDDDSSFFFHISHVTGSSNSSHVLAMTTENEANNQYILKGNEIIKLSIEKSRMSTNRHILLPLSMGQDERATSGRFDDNGERVAVGYAGTSGGVRAFRVYELGRIRDMTRTSISTRDRTRNPINAHASFVGHTGDITCIAFVSTGKRIATGSSDGTVKLWDVGTQECLLTLPGPGGIVRLLECSHDGRRLVAVGEEKYCVWEISPDNSQPKDK